MLRTKPALFLFGVAMAISAASIAAAADALHIRCPNPMIGVQDTPEAAAAVPAEPALHMVGARNSRAIGQVVLSSASAFPAAAATVSDLARKDGGGAIAATHVQLSYAQPDGADSKKSGHRFDSLAAKPQGERAVEVVWLTVRVPAEAAAGAYQGTLAVAGRQVPVTLQVCDWTLPDPNNYASSVGLVQSPESVAMQYQVEQWSERHFQLIGKTFDLLGQVGNDTLYLPMVAKTHFGNSETIVRWIKDGSGYKYDFTPLEKYVDLYLQKVGKPSAVCLYIWDRFADGQAYGKEGKEGLPVMVSLLDPKSGKVELMNGPRLGTPEDVPFWTPVLDGVRARLKQRGIDDRAILIGISGDVAPTKEIVASLQKVAPYACWMVQGHPKVREVHGVKSGYTAYVWGTGGLIGDPAKGKARQYGWKQESPLVVFPRFGCFMNPPLWADAPLAANFVITETALCGGLRGFGRVGADFWPVIKDTRGRGFTIINRFPECQLGQVTLANGTAAMLAPGPDGAVSTVRFELLREGVQETEARIFIEKALTDDARRARLGKELAEKCEALLDERLRAFIQTQSKTKGEKSETDYYWYAAESGWQPRAEKLFTAAGEVARKLDAQ